MRSYPSLCNHLFTHMANNHVSSHLLHANRKILFDFLKRYDIYDITSDKELYSYINQDDARAVLLKKLQDYYEKEYNPY